MDLVSDTPHPFCANDVKNNVTIKSTDSLLPVADAEIQYKTDKTRQNNTVIFNRHC